MIRNLPNKYQRDTMLKEIDAKGFADKYDFFYLPIDKDTKANRGYAFINFINPADAVAFKLKYDGKKLSSYNSNKVVAVTIAELQGFQANHAHYSTSRVNLGPENTRPLFLREEVAEQAEISPIMPRRAAPAPAWLPYEAGSLESATSPPLPPPPPGPPSGQQSAAADWLQPRMPSRMAKFCPICGEHLSSLAAHTYCLYCGNVLCVADLAPEKCAPGVPSCVDDRQLVYTAPPTPLNLQHHRQPFQGNYRPNAYGQVPGLPAYTPYY